MNYIELDCKVFPQRFIEIVMAEFSEFGFESFVENDNGFQGYIPEKDFDETKLRQLSAFENKEIKINYGIHKIADQNWNAVWESDFEPVEIEKLCYIRAPFHPQKIGYKYEIIIEPEMSFGTGHHETTHLMAKLLLEQDVAGKNLLDMGCGTAILAILAHKIGAKHILAVDNDEWAFNNARANIIKNFAPEIEVQLGDATLLHGQRFDIVLANINRNILLGDIPEYASVIKQGGKLLLSGFYESDLPLINEKTAQFGLQYERYVTMHNWCASVYIKS